MATNAAGRHDQFCGGCVVPEMADSPVGGGPFALVCDLLPDRWEFDDCVAIRVVGSLTLERIVCPNAAPATARNPAAIEINVCHCSRLRMNT